MECRACELQMERILCDLPSAWRKQIVEAVCTHIVCKGIPCDQVAACLANELSSLDYKCLVGSQAEWDALSYQGKIQKLIDKICDSFAGLTLDTLDTFSINLTGVGDSSSPLKADVIISPTAGNLTTVVNNGVLTKLTTGNTATVTLAGAGTASSPLTATATITLPPPSTPVTVTTSDTTTINMSGDGTTPISGVVIIDPNPTNLTVATAQGIYTQDPDLLDLVKGLTQHLVFEIPVMDQATWTAEQPPNPRSATNIGIAGRLGGDSLPYATSYANPNPGVTVFWGDSGTYEQTYDNEAGADNALRHNYAQRTTTTEAVIKGYTTNYLTKLGNQFTEAMPSGLRAVKGGEYLTNIHYAGALMGTTGVFDFKGMYNVKSFQIDVYFADTYNAGTAVSGCILRNTKDLHRLDHFHLYGLFDVRTDGEPIEFTSPTLNNVGLIATRLKKGMILENKATPMQVSIINSSLEQLSTWGTNLHFFELTNSGALNGGHYINNFSLKMKPGPYTLGSGSFDFTTLKYFFIRQVNGRLANSLTYVTTPTNVLFPNFTTGKLEMQSMEQDIVKDDAFISFANNGLLNGQVTFNANVESRAFGQNYTQAYYNPSWAPLNGHPTSFGVQITPISGGVGGAVTAIGASSDSQGAGYNTIPIITTSGPGTGLVANALMGLGINTPIINGGSSYVVGQVINFTGGTFVTPAQGTVQSIGPGGTVTGIYISGGGEYSALPAGQILTHPGGLQIDTSNRWYFVRANVTNGGSGYSLAASKFHIEVTSGGGTGSGTASAAAKAAIETLHSRGWSLKW